MTAGISASRSMAPNPRLPIRMGGLSAPISGTGAGLFWPALLAIAIGAVYAGGLRRGMILDDTVIIPRGG